MNNLDGGGQKRIFIAIFIAFIFFIAYDYLYVQPRDNALNAIQAKAKAKAQTTVNSVAGTNTKVAPKSDSSITSTILHFTKHSSNSAKNASFKNISKKDILLSVKTKNDLFEIDKLGRIAQVTLLQKRFVDKEGKQIKLFDKNQLKPLEVRFVDTKLNVQAFKTDVSANAKYLDASNKTKVLVLTQKLKGTTLTKKLTFYPDGHYDLVASANKPFFITSGYRPDVIVDMYADHGAIVSNNNGSSDVIKDEKLDKSQSYKNVQFISGFDRYYTTLLYNFKNPMNVTAVPSANKSPELFIKVNKSISLSGYIGPKDHKALKALNPHLTDVIEYGWFTFIARPMFSFLQAIHNIVGNWGWTIVLLTLIVKLILFPLSYKGMISMQRLKTLAPKIKELQAKYKGDKQKQSTHMMELYKKHGANPMGGCLPMVLQIPVFFAIYRVLLNSIELKGAPWIFWIHDLALMDPYYILPILMGITMYLQQRITPNTMQDPTQRKIFQFLPVIFTFFFLWFPAGLTLYWFVNNLFTAGQQFYINKVFEKQRAKAGH